MNKKSSKKYTAAAVIAAVIFLAAGIAIGVNIQDKEIKNILSVNIDYKESYDGFMVVKPKMDGNMLSLDAECYSLSFGITPDQAFSIQHGIDGVIESRPLTHDSLKDILDTFGIEILSIKIDSETDGIYQAKIVLRQGDKLLNLDTRPSDATAMAVRENIKMYVSNDIMSRFGNKTCQNQ